RTLVRIVACRTRPELFVAAASRRRQRGGQSYTRNHEPEFWNHADASPLPVTSTGIFPVCLSVLHRAADGRPRILVPFPRAPRIPTPILHSDGRRFHLVACGIGGRGRLSDTTY